MLARCGSAGLRGLEVLPVTVEVDIGPGLPGLLMVGLADAAVQESRERVRGALRNSGLKVAHRGLGEGGTGGGTGGVS